MPLKHFPALPIFSRLETHNICTHDSLGPAKEYSLAYVGGSKRQTWEWGIELTERNVPGRKKRVTRVIMRMDTASDLVFRARVCISFVINHILS